MQQRERVLCREPRRDERFEDPVPRHRVECACRVSGDKRAAAREDDPRPPHRQVMAPQAGQLLELDPVLPAEIAEMVTQSRAFVRPAADADVHVIPFRKDPAVAARDRAELEHEHSVPASCRQLLVGKVALERDAVDDRAAEPERASRDPVGTVGADDRVYLNRLAVDPQLGVGDDRDPRAVAELGSRVDRLLDEERVEPAPLGHQAEDSRGLAIERPAVAKTAANARDAVLDDGLDRERQLPNSPRGEPAAARLVAGERRFVY